MSDYFMRSNSDPPPTRSRNFLTESESDYFFVRVNSVFFPLDRSGLGSDSDWIAIPRFRVKVVN